MKKKDLIKKWGRIALMSIAGITAVGAGMVMTDNSNQVSAEENTTYLVRQLKALEDNYREINDVVLFDMKDIEGKVKTSDDINAIFFNFADVRFSGGTFSYGDGKCMKIDIADVDNFDADRDVTFVENTGGGNIITQATNFSASWYLYNSKGGIESFLERTDLYYKINEIMHLAAKKYITLEDESVELENVNIDVMFPMLYHVELDEKNQMAMNPTQLTNVGMQMINDEYSYRNVDINFYIRSANEILYGTIGEAGAGTYTESDINKARDEGYQSGYSDGKKDTDITSDNQEYADNYIKENNYHTDEDYQKYGDDQFTAGVDSVDKDAIKKAGYDEGVASVDITLDNEKAINDYIQNNNMKTEEEYNDYGESKYEEGKQAGIDSVDITTDNQEYADNYIKENNYHTEEDYQKYGDNQFTAGVNSVDKASIKQEGYDAGFIAGEGSVDKAAIKKAGYDEGVASVDITSDNEKAINDYIQDNNMKTEEEYNDYGESKYNSGYKAHTFGAMMKDCWKSVKKAGKSVGDFFVTYIGFGWAWDKNKKFR